MGQVFVVVTGEACEGYKIEGIRDTLLKAQRLAAGKLGGCSTAWQEGSPEHNDDNLPEDGVELQIWWSGGDYIAIRKHEVD